MSLDENNAAARRIWGDRTITLWSDQDYSHLSLWVHGVVQMPRRVRPPLTAEEFEALWRPYPEFIGPVAPPMWLWIRNRDRQERWERLHGLKGEEKVDERSG